MTNDYIKRSSIIKAFENAEPDIVAYYEQHHIYEYAFSRSAVNQIINNIPITHIKEIVKAKWDDNDCCTNCGEESDYNWERGTHFHSNFCPNCGSEMENI